MNIAKTTEKMIAFYEGALHDINHFVKVHAYARCIGLLEQLDAETQTTLEVAAIVHDIACPLCRLKYGKAAGHLQELEGPALAQELLSGLWEQERIDRVCFLVAHHHTYSDVDGLDWQILLEADFLVNADEGKASAEAIARMRETVFKTAAGIRLLDSMYQKVNSQQ